MTELNSTFKLPPNALPIVERTKTTYKNWIIIHRNIPRTERFGIGLKIDTLLLDLLELLRKATYATPVQKIVILDESLGKTDAVRFFMQILWETKLVPNEKFILFAAEIEEIGKMIGGWKKGLVTKTSGQRSEERRQ